ncbi:hypothetical protein LCGC14_2435510, partial [marine sediment metagenome]
YIDLIEADGVPVDLKTAARKWSKGKEHGEMQVDFYLLGLNYEGYDLNPNHVDLSAQRISGVQFGLGLDEAVEEVPGYRQLELMEKWEGPA